MLLKSFKNTSEENYSKAKQIIMIMMQVNDGVK